MFHDRLDVLRMRLEAMRCRCCGARLSRSGGPEREASRDDPRRGLDLTTLRKALVNLDRILDGKRPMADQIKAEYDRLSRSGGEAPRDEEEWQSFRWNG